MLKLRYNINIGMREGNDIVFFVFFWGGGVINQALSHETNY